MRVLMVSRRLLYLLGILLVAACGGPEPSPLATGPTPAARVSTTSITEPSATRITPPPPPANAAPPPVANTPSADHGDTLAITCTTNAQQRTVTCELHGASVGSELNWQVNHGDLIDTGPLIRFVVPALRPDLPVLVDACRLTGANSYDCQTVETTIDTSHLPPKPPGDPPPGIIVELPSAWDRSSCVGPPGTKHAGSDFVYDGGVFADAVQQECVAFEPGSGDY